MNIGTHFHLPGLSPVKHLVCDSLGSARDSVEDAFDGLLDGEVALPSGGVDFGKLGRDLLGGSPLGGFLGLLGIGTAVKAPRVPKAVNTSGSEIPGGSSLYDKGRGMFHKGAPGAPDSYAFENSPAGIQFAAKHGYASIDIDMQITKDGVPVATHWSQPLAKDGFYDPLHKLAKDTRVSEMTLAEVTRLRNADGQSRISPVSSMIGELKKNGIAGDLEAKDDPRFASDQMMGSLAGMVREAGIQANLKSIDRGSGSYDILEAAQRQGFWVRTATGNGHHSREFGYGKPAG
jgi:hypothetical protein